ncbi:MAG: hypothetical protein V1873_02205 [Verrucomicrobiota bacterium]
MRRSLIVAGMLAGLLFGAARLGAEEMVLFNMKTTGADAWSWGQAQASWDAGELVVTENNKLKAHGDIFLSDRLPYLPGGEVLMDVGQVLAGSYTLQVLAFQGNSFLLSSDLIHDALKPGPRTATLNTAGLPPFTDGILFKIWVANAEGAAIRIKDFKYFATLDPTNLIYDRVVEATTPVELDRLTWTPVENAGATIALITNESYGSVLFTDPIPKPDTGTLMIQIPSVKRGSLTVQFAALDGAGQYLSALDVIKRVGAGWRSTQLASLSWPEGTKSFQIKIWLEGVEEASATITRLIVLR